MNIKTTYTQLNSDNILYEIRRNPINIYNFKNIVYKSEPNFLTKINNNNNHEKVKEILLYDNKLEIPIDCSLVFKEYKKEKVMNYIRKKTYIYKIMSMDNIGHFFIDNLIPIIKMIFIDQNIMNKTLSSINRNINIILLKSYNETEKQQSIWKKHLEYLLPFTENKVQFLSNYPNYTLFEDVVMCSLGIKRVCWTQKNDNDNCNIKFITSIKKIYYNFYNITENPSPNKIIILSRQNAKHRKILNENKLFDTLNNKYNNVELIQFEKFNLQQELQLLNNTLLFITPHGAGVISAFFIPQNSTCFIFHPKGYTFECDFPTIYKIYIKRLNINIIQYENNDKRDICRNNIHVNRDKHFYVNIEEITRLADKVMVKIINKDT